MRYHRVRESPILQGSARHSRGEPHFKTVHRTVFERTACCSVVHVLFRAPDAQVFRRLRTSTRALLLVTVLWTVGKTFFCEKEGTENGFAILSGVTVVTVTL